MPTTTFRLMLGPTIVALSLLTTLAATAGEQPASAASAALRVIVPIAPGGTSDVVARILADRLASPLARPVVVENRPGATGRLAVDAFRAAQPSSNAILLAPIAIPVIAPLALGKSYDVADLAPVSQLATFDYAFAVSAKSQWHSFAEFAAWARSKGDDASFGAPGAGSLPHFLGLHLARAARFRTAFIPYASIGKLESDLVGGHVISAVSATPDFVSLHRAGRIRILATTGRDRAALLPDVPTFTELGYDSMIALGWTARFANTGAPAHSIESLSTSVVQVLRDANVRSRLQSLGIEPTGTTPQQLQAIIARDIAYWAPIIRASGFVEETP